MDSKLSAHEIAVLRSVAGESESFTGAIPKRLMEFGFIERIRSKTWVTKKGLKKIFQCDCIAALKAIESNLPVAPAADVFAWLEAGGFLAYDEDGELLVSKRGQLWVESFEPLVLKQPSLTAEHFSIRRAGRGAETSGEHNFTPAQFNPNRG